MPETSPEVSAVLKCFLLCQTQVRRTSEGVYGMEWGIIRDVAESLDINIDGHFYRLLSAYEGVMLEEVNRK